MRVFNEAIEQLRDFVRSREHRSWKREKSTPWPTGGRRNLVLGEDVGCELGHPRRASLSSLLWTEDPNRIHGDVITLIGPDLGESLEASLPFGRIALVEVHAWDQEDPYPMYLEMEALRHEVDLKGYMIRAVSGAQNEWCRISKDAVAGGFRFAVLGAALIEKLKERPFVRKAELLYVTSCEEDVKSIQTMVNPTLRMIRAMRKMDHAEVLDCDTCEYSDVCSEIRLLTDRRKKRRAACGSH